MKKYFKISKKALRLPLVFLFIFYAVAYLLYQSTGYAFYLFNFVYIGTSIAIGVFLSSTLTREYSDWGRRVTQLLVGTYMLGYVGFIMRENMQIEGFFLYASLGVFAGASLHYFIAKIFGVVIFGRGWCGYACWTAMVLDILPWKSNAQGRIKRLGLMRYLHFFVVAVMFFILWNLTDIKGVLFTSDLARIEMSWLIAGNLAYYALGIILASMFKDNRAFCKYACPIPTLMKVGSRFSLMKIEIDSSLCVDCGKCEQACLMDIKLLDYKESGQRVLSTECILCQNCALSCPTHAISTTLKIDFGVREKLRYKIEL